MPLLIFIYSMMWHLIYKYETFWLEVCVESLILRWELRTMGLFLILIDLFLVIITIYLVCLIYACQQTWGLMKLINQYEWLICPRQCYKMCRKETYFDYNNKNVTRCLFTLKNAGLYPFMCWVFERVFDLNIWTYLYISVVIIGNLAFV